ncbi:hypothetical protein RND71_014481 [Anisodus tanguticus]|uniref:Uncharacterized protein n=1 Tax=Anisodus tanguticus TaxID=243964 RepID=A0AAE1SBC5_9SOLA|nr:hypothetical protein RND71_014481 [Anisodus tanguticus]
MRNYCYQLEQRKETIGNASRKKGLWIEEEEETLSLSDLPINDDHIDYEEWEKYYDCKSSTSSSSSYSPNEDHVFEFIRNTNNALPPENILFCGKLIPYRNANDDQTEMKKRPEKRGYFGLNSFSFSRGNSSRWYIFLFGTAGFPTVFKLKDLKSRQSRKVNASSTDRSKGKGMWPLINALSCSGGGSTYHTPSVVKASIKEIQLRL